MRVIDEREIRNRIEPHLTLQFRANTDALRPYLEALEEVQLGLRSPELVERQRGDVEGFAEMYDAYRDGPRARRRDRLRRSDRARDRDAAARARHSRRALQRECRHLLVDEFQDLRPAHLLLVRLVAAPAYDVFGVGDDDQVIYGYSGADPGFLIDFADYFPGAAIIRSRSTTAARPPVVDGARMLLAHNRRRVEQGDARRARARPTTFADALQVERRAGEEVAPHATDLIEEWLDRRARRPSRSRCCAA